MYAEFVNLVWKYVVTWLATDIDSDDVDDYVGVGDNVTTIRHVTDLSLDTRTTTADIERENVSVEISRTTVANDTAHKIYKIDAVSNFIKKKSWRKLWIHVVKTGVLFDFVFFILFTASKQNMRRR